jgi:ABC-type Fe3+/spermidine/putrescine transport system ATPase subunit
MNGTLATVKTPDGLEITIPSPNGSSAAGSHVICGIRPERLQVGKKLDTQNAFPGTLRVMNFQFGYYRAQVDLPSGQRLLAEIHEDNPDVHEGEDVSVGWNVEDALVFTS